MNLRQKCKKLKQENERLKMKTVHVVYKETGCKLRKTKHNALDENAIYGPPIWKSDGAKGSGFVEDYNRESSPHPSFSCGLTPVSKNVFMSLTIRRGGGRQW